MAVARSGTLCPYLVRCLIFATSLWTPSSAAYLVPKHLIIRAANSYSSERETDCTIGEPDSYIQNPN